MADSDNNIFSSFQGIPIEYLISAPLMAAARANEALAQAMIEYVEDIAYETDDNGDPDTSKTATLEFDLDHPYQDQSTGDWTSDTLHLSCPLLALVPIPSLLVDNVTIDFTASVEQNTQKTKDKSRSLNGSFGYGGFSMSGSATTTTSNTRSTDYSATYTFHVQADQQPATEGMNTLMDVFSSVMTPQYDSGGDDSSGDDGGS